MVVFESDDSPEATTSRAAGITRNVDGIDTRGAAKNGSKNPDLSAFLKFELGEDVGQSSLWSWMNVKSLNRKMYPVLVSMHSIRFDQVFRICSCEINLSTGDRMTRSLARKMRLGLFRCSICGRESL